MVLNQLWSFKVKQRYIFNEGWDGESSWIEEHTLKIIVLCLPVSWEMKIILWNKVIKYLKVFVFLISSMEVWRESALQAERPAHGLFNLQAIGELKSYGVH